MVAAVLAAVGALALVVGCSLVAWEAGVASVGAVLLLVAADLGRA